LTNMQSATAVSNDAAQSLKGAKSSQFFKDTKVSSCSHVVVRNGAAEAIPFRTSKKEETFKQSCSTSLTHDTYKVSATMHTGMDKKPLCPYDPLSYRNRLPVQDARKPPKNSSQIEFGDRSVADKKHFVTTNKNTYGSLAKNEPITNGGIVAEKTKWSHYLQGK